jgi:t-SNARE complex subunit (syntaxin)
MLSVSTRCFGINADIMNKTPLKKSINKSSVALEKITVEDFLATKLKFCEDENNNNNHNNNDSVKENKNQTIINNKMDSLLYVFEGHIRCISDSLDGFIRQCASILQLKEELETINFVDLFGKLCKLLFYCYNNYLI